MPTDPKWRTIARKSGQPLPCVIALFNLIMVNASGNADDRGTLHNWNDDDAAAALDMEPEAVCAIIAAMQGKVLEANRLTGWEKRQPKREDDGAAARKAAQRERQRTQADAMSRTVTHGHAPEIDTDAEIDAEIGGAKAPKSRGRVHAFPCPENVDPVDWDALKANRKAKRAALTEGAYRQIIGKLEQWGRQGWPPGPLVAYAAERGWTTVFETDEMKENGNGKQSSYGKHNGTSGKERDGRDGVARALDRRLGLDEPAGEIGRRDLSAGQGYIALPFAPRDTS
jgi:hypothetical protein